MTTADQLLITNIGTLVTMDPIAKQQKIHSITLDDLGVIHGGWLAIENGKIAAFSSGLPSENYAQYPTINAKEGLVLPGFIDAHTHPIFAGSRAHEFCAKICGATYQEISEAGGGICHTVQETRKASSEELLSSTVQRLRDFLENGVTTVEVKSGYGLSTKEELRLLQILNEAKSHTPQTLSVTCLALHAVPKEAASTERFIAEMTRDLLPEVKKQNLATWVDAFIEKGYFSTHQVAGHFDTAKRLGFGIRVHADEFSDAGAALYAAQIGAHSADHLECAPENSLKAMAKAKTVGVILPGTSLYSAIPFTKAAPFIQNKTPLAIATDFNPGSCCLKNLPFIASIAAVQCRIDLAHTLAAITFVPAYSLGISKEKGALAIGYDADFVLYKHASCEAWLSDFGQTKPEKVFVGGKYQ